MAPPQSDEPPQALGGVCPPKTPAMCAQGALWGCPGGRSPLSRLSTGFSPLVAPAMRARDAFLLGAPRAHFWGPQGGHLSGEVPAPPDPQRRTRHSGGLGGQSPPKDVCVVMICCGSALPGPPQQRAQGVRSGGLWEPEPPLERLFATLGGICPQDPPWARSAGVPWRVEPHRGHRPWPGRGPADAASLEGRRPGSQGPQALARPLDGCRATGWAGPSTGAGAQA